MKQTTKLASNLKSEATPCPYGKREHASTSVASHLESLFARQHEIVLHLLDDLLADLRQDHQWHGIPSTKAEEREKLRRLAALDRATELHARMEAILRA